MPRYEPDGTLAWVVQVGGRDEAYGAEVALLDDGGCTLVGIIRGLAGFGDGVACTALLSAGDADLFLARYAADRTLVWAKRAGGTADTAGLGVAVLPDGRSVVCGDFDGTATFGEGAAAEPHTSTSRDAFVACYATDGTVTWLDLVAGPDFVRGAGITTLADGSCALLGGFYGSATFSGGVVTLTSAGDVDGHVACYASDGALVWARRAGGSLRCDGNGISAVPDGSFVWAGSFEGTTTFGPGAYTLQAFADPAVFVARYNAEEAA